MRAALKFLRELYDWGSFGDAAIQGIQMMFGVSVIGGMGAAIVAVVAGATGVQIALAALLFFIAANVYGIHTKLKLPPRDLEIVYDENDPRFVRPASDHVRYYVGLHILCQRSVEAPNVRAQEGQFTNEILALAHGGDSYGNVEIYKGGRLDWDDLEIFELVGISKTPDSEGMLSRSHRFTLEARGLNVRVARADFEYDPTKMPMIRMLPR
jgi:hypothetical protein